MKTTKTMTTGTQKQKKVQTEQQSALKKQYHWPFDLNTKSVKKIISSFILVMLAFSFSNSMQAQNNNELTINGIVSDENGPVDQVTITLKGTETRTISDKKGMFTFPETLKENDVLVFSHLGYHPQEVTINKDAPFVKVQLDSETIEILGALQSNKPYKSKRKK